MIINVKYISVNCMTQMYVNCIIRGTTNSSQKDKTDFIQKLACVYAHSFTYNSYIPYYFL